MRLIGAEPYAAVARPTVEPGSEKADQNRATRSASPRIMVEATGIRPGKNDALLDRLDSGPAFARRVGASLMTEITDHFGNLRKLSTVS
jgi:hypothetical protein